VGYREEGINPVREVSLRFCSVSNFVLSQMDGDRLVQKLDKRNTIKFITNNSSHSALCIIV
jgi:hypothetical protein